MRVNRAVYLNTLRWFLDSPARLMAAGLMAFLAYLAVGGMAHFQINGVASGLFSTPGALAGGGDKALVLLAWILGVGVIRREVASGAIQLVLLRPLTRAGYVLSKWAALATLMLAFLVFCYGVLLLRGGAASMAPGDLGLLFGAQAMQTLALAAVLTCLSAVPFNLGELGLLLLAVVGLLITAHYAESLDQAWMRSVVDFGYKVLFPRVGAFTATDGGDGVDSLASLLFNAGVTVAALGLGMALLQQREFTYAETGP
jgi:ABC-type transport system involved in multi-copper enzyme maturation permease subunit